MKTNENLMDNRYLSPLLMPSLHYISHLNIVSFLSVWVNDRHKHLGEDKKEVRNWEGKEKDYHRKELINYKSIWKSLRKTSECQQNLLKWNDHLL